jgi:CubicO group peptidase (beta-lactamase class C family)
MRKILLFLLVVISITSVSAQQKSQTNDKRLLDLDSAFARVLTNWKGPGFAVAVVEKNKIIYAKGFGYRDLKSKLPVTPNTLFAIGSCTKAFTASLVGKLAAKDMVNLDKPVRDYFPELKFYNDEMNDRITLRDMMCHRTGLPRHDLSWLLFPTTRDSMVDRIQFMEPSGKVREKWQYNNFMFMAQGAVIEKITHHSWEDNIRDSLFIPLGMSRSCLSVLDMEKDSNAATGYTIRDTGNIRYAQKDDYYHIDAMGPAGGINSSVADMSCWLKTWINGGKFEGKQIIPAAFVQDAMSSQMIIYPGLPEADTKDIQFANYGLAWMLASYRGHYRVEHGGNIDGFSASTCFFPSDSLGIVVLANQNNSEIPGIVRNIISDRIFGLKYFDWDSWKYEADKKNRKANKDGENAKIASVKTGTNSFHTLKDYTGFFNNKGYGTIDVFTEHDSLFARTGERLNWLKPNQYNWFKAYDKGKNNIIDTTGNGLDIEFRTNVTGDIYEIDASLEPSVKAIAFNRIPREANISTDSLKKFEGEYSISSIVLTVFLSGKFLHMTVPGQPEFTLLPVDKNKFALKGYDGFTITFVQDSKSSVTELISTQPNGTFKATRKK